MVLVSPHSKTNDENQIRNKEIEAIQGLGESMTKTPAKKAKEALNQMMTTFIEQHKTT